MKVKLSRISVYYLTDYCYIEQSYHSERKAVVVFSGTGGCWNLRRSPLMRRYQVVMWYRW